MRKRLGIYGGTFDPIHMGHMLMADLTRQECQLEKVLFIPAGCPPHKNNKYITSPIQRFEMTCKATADNPDFEVSDIELQREGRSFTVDTLKFLRDIYTRDWQFWLIIGGDSFMEIKTWRNASEVMRLCNLAVYIRPGYSLDVYNRQAEVLHKEEKVEIVFVHGPLISISSTDIRDRVSKGKSIKYMVPNGVGEYIEEKGLYGSIS